jgi:hypothetical protein
VPNTIMPTVFATGVRRMRTLNGWPMLGAMGTPPDQTTIAELVVNGGYDMDTINTLIAQGATNEQLQALPYPATADERAAGITNLMNQLGGAQAAPGAPATSARSYPQGAIPVIQTDLFGNLDLSLRSTWDVITSQFTQIGQQLNAIAAQRPNDPTVIQMRAQYNALATQFTNAWSKVFNTSSPIRTLGTWQDIAATSGIVILGGVAIASGVGIPLVAVIGTILAGLYVIGKWINSQNVQAAVSGQQAQNQTALLSAAAAADAAGNPTLAANYRYQAAALGPATPGVAQDWSYWLQSNVGWIFGAMVVALVGMKVIKKI